MIAIQRLIPKYLFVLVLICLAANTNATNTHLGADGPLIDFAVPTQNLSASLILVSKQASIPIIFSSSIVENYQAPALNGRLSLDNALIQLLKGSNLYHLLVDNRFITVINKPLSGAIIDQEMDVIKPARLEYIRIYGQVVTGSRIKRTDYVSSTPVDILEEPEIGLRGSFTVVEKLKFIPAVSGSPTSTAVTNGGDGTATVTLRGMPASNTLVLINGRRVASDGLEGDAINLNTISPTTIDRIEILKDGASSIYGADAIAGVVNVILKNDVDGLQIDSSYGETSRGDMNTYNTSLLWGKTFSRGYASIAATHYQQGGINSRDREQANSADGRSWGGVDNRSSATPASRVTLPTGDTVTLDKDSNGNYLGGINPSDYRLATGEDLYNYASQTTAFMPHIHDNISANFQFEFDSNISFFLDTSFDRTSTESFLAPTPLFTAFENTPITIAADNIYNPFNLEVSGVRRRMVELPRRMQKNNSKAKRLATGIAGIKNQWFWDISYTWSKNDAEEKLKHLLNAENIQLALGPSAQCIDQCVPLNLFGPPGSIDNDQLDFITINSAVRGFSKLTSWTANASGPLMKLPAGQVDAAMGIEYRREVTSKTPDQAIANGLTIGGANFGAAGGSRSVGEAYIETSLPLLHHQFGINSLILELSSRYSHYSDFGSTVNPKVGIMLRPSADLLLRATYTNGFRAPALNELYKVSSESQAFLVDPCSDPANTGVYAGCPQQTDPTRVQYLTLFGGNENLKPEKSLNNTFGMVWTPALWNHFTASIDFFRIKQDDVIDANAQNLININAKTGLLDSVVVRNGNHEIQRILAYNINTGTREVKGVDLSARYEYHSKNYGQFTFALNSSHFFQYKVQAYKQSKSMDIAGTFVDDATDGLGAIPQWKGNIGMLWKKGGWLGGYTIHFISSLTENIPMSNIKRKIDSWTTHDIQLGYNFNIRQGLRVVAGLDNLFDRDPPLIASAFNDNIDARTHELKGRFLYLKFRQKI